MNLVLAVILACLQVTSVEEALVKCKAEVASKTQTKVVARVTCACADPRNDASRQ